MMHITGWDGLSGPHYVTVKRNDLSRLEARANAAEEEVEKLLQRLADRKVAEQRFVQYHKNQLYDVELKLYEVQKQTS